MSFIYEAIEENGLKNKEEIAKELGVEVVDMAFNTITVQAPILNKYNTSLSLSPSVGDFIRQTLKKYGLERLYVEEVRNEYHQSERVVCPISSVEINFYTSDTNHPITLAHFDKNGFWFNVGIFDLSGARPALDEILKDLFGLPQKNAFNNL
jgi:hypothetical protein